MASMTKLSRTRVENALWGIFVGDAPAMPVHWYYDRKNLFKDFPDGITGYEAIMGVFATACYPEHGFPLSLYLALRHRFDVRSALSANANAGGDNVHRRMVLGSILGAAVDVLPSELKDELLDASAIADEIDAAIRTIS